LRRIEYIERVIETSGKNKPMLAKESIEHGHRVYTVEMHEIKTLRGMLDELAANASTGTKLAPTRSVASILVQLQGIVHPSTVSKVVDENGEPLVVYHGTNATHICCVHAVQ